jgi:tetratricopeptide (TPR) repeat protein
MYSLLAGCMLLVMGSFSTVTGQLGEVCAVVRYGPGERSDVGSGLAGGSDVPQVGNTVSGTVMGVVQAGVVHGDVHLHALPAPLASVPRQLPAAPGVFAGRVAELAALDRILAVSGRGSGDPTVPAGDRAVPGVGGPVMISAIGGVGGVGKTWLALAWAHRNLGRFPDGQLFVDLRGFSPAGEPVAPVEAVRGFLAALGVEPGGLPSELGALAALYRSLVAGRRMLVVLDNAATAEQVVPLLPGSATCTVLVTGRAVLSSLIDRHGAHHLPLDVPGRDEARAVLVARLDGDRRVDVEPEAVDELVGLCGHHPLALAIMARLAATRLRVPLAELAAELRELGLEVLDHHTDPAVSLPAVLSWSLHRFTAEQRMMFALLGITPGPDIDLSAAAALTGLPEARARQVLLVLQQASLLDEHPYGRYRMHDLVRACAAATARADLSASSRRAALDRVVDFYRYTAHAVERLLYPHRPLIRLDEPASDVRPRSLSGLAAALAWMDTHHHHLLAAQRTAAEHERHDVVWHVAWTLHTFHQRRGHRNDELTVWQAGLDAARHLSDPAPRTRAHRRLGRALAEAGQHHDPTQMAHTHHYLARAWELRGDDRRALEHARQALDLFRDLDHPVWEAEALNATGWYAACLGDHDAAREHCQAALALFQRHPHPDGQANTLDSLGLIAYRTGHHDEAVHYYEQALALFHSLGNTAVAIDTLDRLGQPHAALGRHAQARAVWQEALELYRQQGRSTDIERVQRQLDSLDQHDAMLE